MGTFASVSLYDRGSTRPVSGRTVRVTSWPDGGPVETDPAVLTTDYYGATPEFTVAGVDVVRVSAGSSQARVLVSIEKQLDAAPELPPTADDGQVLTWDASVGEWVARSGTSGTGGTTDHAELTNRSAPNQHPISAITDLQVALNNKAEFGHQHPVSDVTGLQAALDGKQAAGSYAPLTHTHTAANVTDLTEAVDDRVSTLIVAGTGITKTYDDTAGTLTLAASGGGGSAYPQVAPEAARIFFPPHSSLGTTSVNNNVYLTPLEVPYGTITEIGIEVTTAAASSVLRLGLYTPWDNGTWPKTRLVDAGTVDVSTTGWKSIVLASPIAWTGGLLYGAVYRPTTSATPQVRSAVGGSQRMPVGSYNDIHQGFYMTGNNDAGLPATFSAAAQNYQPMLFGVRVS